MDNLEQRVEKIEKSINWLKFGNYIYLPVIFLFVIGNVFLFTGSFRAYDVGATRHYVGNELIKRAVKVHHISFVPSTTNGGILDISSYGLATIANVQATVVRNTATANDVPSISIKSISTSAIAYNVMTANGATVAILGINVLSGSPQVFATNPSTLTIYLTITGY